MMRKTRLQEEISQLLLPPQPFPTFPCLFLIPPELLHIFKRVFDVCKSISLFDDLCIEKSPIHEIDIGQNSTVPVPPGLAIFKPNLLSFHRPSIYRLQVVFSF